MLETVGFTLLGCAIVGSVAWATVHLVNRSQAIRAADRAADRARMDAEWDHLNRSRVSAAEIREAWLLSRETSLFAREKAQAAAAAQAQAEVVEGSMTMATKLAEPKVVHGRSRIVAQPAPVAPPTAGEPDYGLLAELSKRSQDFMANGTGGILVTDHGATPPVIAPSRPRIITDEPDDTTNYGAQDNS